MSMDNAKIKQTMTNVVDNSECYLKPALRMQAIVKQIKEICCDEVKYNEQEKENEDSKV
jgi:hypothetical protein